MKSCPETGSAADAVCASFGTRPLVALFIVGAARTFSQPLLYLTIRTNLVEAFGGQTTVFVNVKLKDDRGDRRLMYGRLITPSYKDTLAAVRALDQTAHRVVSRIRPGEWNGPCSDSMILKGRRHDLSHSLHQQAMSRAESLEMLLADEARHNITYQTVIFTRPDVAWPLPIRPWCWWPTEIRSRLTDWSWIFPRRDSEVFLGGPRSQLAARCQHSFGTVEGFMHSIYSAPEHFDDLPGIVTRQNRRGMPETSSRQRNKYQLRWRAIDGRQIGDDITFRNPCSNVNVSS